MGSIYSINSNKNNWILTDKTATLKETNEEVLEVIIGYADYDYEGSSDITIWMRKSIYDNVISGKYTIDKNCYFTRELIIYDENKNVIQPVQKDFIY